MRATEDKTEGDGRSPGGEEEHILSCNVGRRDRSDTRGQQRPEVALWGRACQAEGTEDAKCLRSG